MQNIEVEISDGQVQNDRPNLRSNFHMSDLAIFNKKTVRSFVLPLLGIRHSHHDPEIILWHWKISWFFMNPGGNAGIMIYFILHLTLLTRWTHFCKYFFYKFFSYLTELLGRFQYRQNASHAKLSQTKYSSRPQAKLATTKSKAKAQGTIILFRH